MLYVYIYIYTPISVQKKQQHTKKLLSTVATDLILVEAIKQMRYQNQVASSFTYPVLLASTGILQKCSHSTTSKSTSAFNFKHGRQYGDLPARV
jgi:hypothetical protein